MNAIDRVKKSRGINELAEQIEPLAQSMATLADEARQVMSQTQQASEAQAAEWLKAQRQTGAAWVELAKELREVAAEVSSAAQSARSASRGWHWKLWLTVMLASMMPTVVLLIASLLLLDLTPLTTEGRRLMVLDTLRRFHIEEENASGPMAQVIGRMEAIAADTGCSIVFLHHASKGAAMMGAGDQQQTSRGSSVLVDNIRWQSYLSSMTSAEAEEWGVDDDQRRFFVRFGVSKANYGAPFADRWFRRHDGGVLKPAVLERQRKSKGVPRGEA